MKYIKLQEGRRSESFSLGVMPNTGGHSVKVRAAKFKVDVRVKLFLHRGW